MKTIFFLAACISFASMTFAQNHFIPDVSVSSVSLSFIPITKQPSILPNPNGNQQPAKSIESNNPNVSCTFAISVADDSATNVQATATLECNCTILSKGLAKKVYPITNKDGTVYWNLIFALGNMAKGQSQSFDFTMTGDKIQNAIKVQVYSSDLRDGRPYNNSRSATLPAKGL
jgi:hypothetical protein